MPANSPTTFAAPEIDVSTVQGTKWASEYEEFRRLKPALLEQFSGQYVVIHEGQVVDHGSDEVELALRFFSRFGNTAAHIGLVSQEPEPVFRMPHYRVVSGDVG